jgi:hypothetical protein
MKTKSSTNWNLLENFTFKDGTDVDRSVWQSPQWSPTSNPSFLGQTSLRNIPDYGSPLGCVPVTGGIAQLYLDTFNPKSSPAGTSFLGAQIGTIKKWGLATYESVAFEAEVIFPTGGTDAAPGGVVAALFAYNLISQSPFLHDEIDFEFASNFWQGANEAVNTNVYVVTGSNMPNYDNVVNTQINLSGPVVLRLEWSAAGGVRWYINQATNPNPIYTEANVPLSDMGLVLNFWVPDSGWNWAYNSNLLPTAAAGDQWTFQVSWAKVWVKPYTMEVQAAETWQNTGITVNPGDTISIQYESGMWTADPKTNGGNMYDAAGCTGLKVNQPGFTLLGENMGALCGFVGAQPVGDGSDDAFLVANGYSGTSQASGALWLCINDDLKGRYGSGLTDNSGSVTVSVTVS